MHLDGVKIHHCILHACGQTKEKQVAFNYALRILLMKPRWNSTSKMFVAAGVSTFQVVLRKLMYNCVFRLDVSEIEILVTTKIRFSTTVLWRH